MLIPTFTIIPSAILIQVYLYMSIFILVLALTPVDDDVPHAAGLFIMARNLRNEVQ